MTDDASLAPALAHPVAIACAARTNVLVRTHPAPALAPYRSPVPSLASASPRGFATGQCGDAGGGARAYHKSAPLPALRQE
jgi:hypothetical protein